MVETSRKSIVVKDSETIENIETIRERLGLKHYSEVIRFLVRFWELNERKQSQNYDIDDVLKELEDLENVEGIE